MVVAPPSKVNSTGYEVIRTCKINTIPSELIDWLIVGQDRAPTNQPNTVRSPETPNSYGSSDYEYLLDDSVVIDILNRLGDEYLDDYSKWITATSALKRHNKFKIWNDWSKRSSHYNCNKNITIWNYNKGNVDINLLVFLVQQKEGNKTLKFVETYKKYEPIKNTDLSQLTRKTMNHKFVFDKEASTETLNYEIFNTYSSIIIKSCTGTGKTTAIATHAKKYIKRNPNTRILTITTRTTLSDQHQLSFSETKMGNYQSCKSVDLHRVSSLTICINSIKRISMLDEQDLSNYIVYVDEVASFLQLTHNNTLDLSLNETFTAICSIIRYAKKVIVPDAMINDSVFFH